MKRVVLTLALVVMIGLAGCQFGADQNSSPSTPDGQETPEPTPEEQSLENNGITRTVDEEAGVVCYKYSGYEEGGLSCVPLSETNLTAE